MWWWFCLGDLCSAEVFGPLGEKWAGTPILLKQTTTSEAAIRFTESNTIQKGMKIMSNQLRFRSGQVFLHKLRVDSGTVIEAGDMVKSTIRACASFGHQHMDMRMEVDAVNESLDHGHHSRYKLKACGCEQKFHK